MATSDDPPFLTVGTEVSAKYRGAFCEATIKVAKKLVKCKVSYSKGNTALVSNEVVKGTLKVGTPVEVRQPDGQFLTATIMKLTDQSTYTVVFDDGDERTLKRSSLCLKGGRHFDKSESLDNLPLTDPENFGTPVLHSTKKPSRKRRRCSQSPSRKEDGVNGKRPCSYPDEFPVGKAVFLENDRRRSCWLPAVIVPAHYVMEESDRTPDTICLRSFKDGRFFASTKDELHDFAPDKEPLLSMLEGDVQPMYMCKPAIERAMAYLDTGELPWDMDLFDKSIERHSATPTDEEEGEEDSMAEAEEFHEKFRKFHESKGNQIHRRPTLGQKDLNLFKLYKLVKENGGMDKVTQELKWRSLYLQMGMPSTSNASYAIKQAYKKYLYAFEVHEKGKVKQAVKESPGWPNRRKRNAEERSSEERDKAVSEKPPAAKVMKPTVKEEETEDVDMAEVMSQNNDTKSETSDQDSSSQAENSSSNGDECPSHFSTYPNSAKLVDEDSVSSMATYKAGDRIKVYYGKGKNLCLYEAKIIEVEEGEAGRDYLVHYNGWNNRYDEWINDTRICEKVTGPSKAIRPQYAKKKANKKKFAQTRASSDGPTISSAPSSTAVTPQQQQQTKKKIADAKDVTPTLVLDKLMTIPVDKTPQTVSSCPVTPAVSGKMVNGGHLPTPPQSSGGGGGKGGGSSGKGNSRATKRRKFSQSNETQTQPPPPPPPPSLSSVPPPSTILTPSSITSSTTTATTASSRVSPSPPSFPDFNTPPPPSFSRDQCATIKVEGGTPVNLAVSTPSVVTSAPSPLPQTTACQVQALLDLKHVVLPKSNNAMNVDTNGKVALPTGLNGAVMCGNAGKNSLNKTDHLQGQNQVKVKKEEESFGWNAALNSTNKNSRNFPNVTAKAEALGAEVLGSLCQAYLLRDTASSLICSERVPGMISADLKPVIQPVRQIVRQSPNSLPRNRPSPMKKNANTSTVTNPPDPSPSSVFQNPPDSPPSSQSAAESSPSPPSSPNLSSSLKKLSHSSSSSSLASSLSTPAPSTSLLGMNGVMRLEESTIQERDIPEEARMDMDDSNLPNQDSPTSTLSDNLSEKERLSTGEQNVRSKGSQSPDDKRKWRGCETEEEMRERRRARRAALNFMVDFTKLPEMSSAEKVTLIQERMKNIQKKWVELKAEMSKIDRKRRKARKREREAARLAASQAQEATRRSSSPSSTAATTGSTNSVVAGQQIPPVILECH